MKLLQLIYKEILGLFVDDGSLAVLSLVLVAFVAGLVKLLALPPLLGAAILLVGCLAVLVESVVRGSKPR